CQAEGGDRAPDEVSSLLEGLVAAAQGIEGPGATAVEDDLCPADEPAPDLRRLGSREAERDPSLTRVRRGEGIGALSVRHAVDERAGVARTRTPGRLHTYDVRTGVGKQLAGHLAAVAHLDHAQALEWPGLGGSGRGVRAHS